MRMRQSLPFSLALCLLSSVCWSSAYAHSMYQSSVLLEYHAAAVDAELQMPPSRLSQAMGVALTKENLSSLQQQIENYILPRFRIHSENSSDWKSAPSAPVSWEQIDGAPYVVARLHFTLPSGVSVRRLTIQDDVITQALPSHAVLVSIRSDWNSSTFANEPELVGVLNGQEGSIDIDRSQGGWAKGFGSVFHLGIRHIAEGTDHLLFLLALLLPAPLLCMYGRWAGFAGLRHGFTQILKVVTAFTIGHSITLVLAATGIVRVPAKPIEVLIAGSILISAIHALKPLFPGRESFIAAGFGLVHGLAFASTLAELGLRGWERAASILAFNLGIESMQLVVVLFIMPSLMLLSRTLLYPAFRMTGALSAGLAACGWIFERLSDHSLRVDVIVGGLAKHSLTLAILLLILSIASFSFHSFKLVSPDEATRA